MATLPGEPFYRALGFVALERSRVALPDGQALPVVRMAVNIEVRDGEVRGDLLERVGPRE